MCFMALEIWHFGFGNILKAFVPALRTNDSVLQLINSFVYRKHISARG